MTTSARDQFEKQLHESLESLKEQREKNTQNHKEINELKQQAISQKCDMLYGGKGNQLLYIDFLITGKTIFDKMHGRI